MDNNTVKIYMSGGICWDYEVDINGVPYDVIALCPKKNCHGKLIKDIGAKYKHGEWKYKCIVCDCKITLNKSIEEEGKIFLHRLESQKYKDAELIKIDDELIKLTESELKDDKDYWITAKLSENKRGNKQLMILVGSKREEDKTQLFIDIANEKLSFDQNNIHPKEIFTKVVATFKTTKSIVRKN